MQAGSTNPTGSFPHATKAFPHATKAFPHTKAFSHTKAFPDIDKWQRACELINIMDPDNLDANIKTGGPIPIPRPEKEEVQTTTMHGG